LLRYSFAWGIRCWSVPWAVTVRSYSSLPSTWPAGLYWRALQLLLLSLLVLAFLAMSFHLSSLDWVQEVSKGTSKLQDARTGRPSQQMTTFCI
jgi:hypothetical protein